MLLARKLHKDLIIKHHIFIDDKIQLSFLRVSCCSSFSHVNINGFISQELYKSGLMLLKVSVSTTKVLHQ